ncbi:SRPBCC family protein [Pseudonocardiaceae bacterium YIM PH 21723]|nr:SRPBCC family protein [Pseudonocardiaceae bacterium YIM PH 21723]
MVNVNISREFAASPDAVWAKLADLEGRKDWLTIHKGWKSDTSVEPSVGAQLSEVVVLMGMANKIDWTVTAYEPPKQVAMQGTGMAGVKVQMTMVCEPTDTGSKITIDSQYEGQMIVGPIGMAVAKNSKAELEKSLDNFAKLVEA